MNHASEEAMETEPVTNNNFFATPGPITQPLEKNGKCENRVTSQLYSFQTIFVQKNGSITLDILTAFCIFSVHNIEL